MNSNEPKEASISNLIEKPNSENNSEDDALLSEYVLGSRENPIVIDSEEEEATINVISDNELDGINAENEDYNPLFHADNHFSKPLWPYYSEWKLSDWAIYQNRAFEIIEREFRDEGVRDILRENVTNSILLALKLRIP